MKSKYLLFSFIALGACSCKWGVPPKQNGTTAKDTLSYTYKAIKERATDCGSKPDSSCSVAKISYPYFNGQQKLNDSVSRKLTSIFVLKDKPDTTLTQLTHDFFANYQKDKETLKDPQIYSLDCAVKVLRQDSGLVTLQVYGYISQGGAHPTSGTYFINWDTKTNKNIALDDLFDNGYQDKLTKIAEGIFRKNEKLADTASLANNYFFKDAKFALNNNFSITPLGLKFLYNEYEIKPYSAGTTDLFIPYAQIKSLLKPNTVVSQYIK
jgi:hypothetical protein